MAAKGGGAWKVAYADFVTAMMAFFLVMWICGQDQQLKRAVSYYFQNPLGTHKDGNAKSPSESGSLTDLLDTGSVPKSQSVALGKGRQSHTDSKNRGPSTKLVGDFIHKDKEASTYWREQALKQYETARTKEEVRKRMEPAEKAATVPLARQLRDEMLRGIPEDVNPVHRAMLLDTIGSVQWTELAEDLLHPEFLLGGRID